MKFQWPCSNMPRPATGLSAPLELRQLRYFVKIVEEGSMSRAALELCVAQSALSLQIATLETRLRQKLLMHRSTGVEPTAAGKALYRHAVAILRQVERLLTMLPRRKRSPAWAGVYRIAYRCLRIDLRTRKSVE
jgi:DNA-binding transcriptional LysR family regulator